MRAVIFIKPQSLSRQLPVRHARWLAGSLAALTLSAADRPNILFILTEDQGAQMGFLGTPGLQTPHMDSLARSGMFFNNAFVVYPVCSASKAAIYTGLHNHANGILNNTLNLHKPATKLTAAERNQPLFRNNRIRAASPCPLSKLAVGCYSFSRKQAGGGAAFMPLHRPPARRPIISSWFARTLKRPEGRAPGQCQDAPHSVVKECLSQSSVHARLSRAR